MRFKELRNKLRRGIFLSSMMGITDGKYCAERGQGCTMIQLGAYLAEPSESGKEKWFLPSNPTGCTAFFKDEIRHLKYLDAVTCLNLATPRLEWGLEAAECFRDAGGDIVELNVHGGYRPYLEQGKLRAMVLPENRTELYNWVEAFIELDMPLIVKFRAGFIEDYTPILDRINEYDVFGVHFNIADEENKRPNIDFLRGLKRDQYILLVSGYVRSREDVDELLGTGADLVGVARPTRENASFIELLISKPARARARGVNY
jgi:tRNA-dihydrouridine synthase